MKVWFWFFGILMCAMIVSLQPLFRPLASLVQGPSLVVFTNEYEARPCGGFITAFAEMKGLKVRFKNVYHFEKNVLGNAPIPLNQITSDLKFWDLGINPNQEVCATTIKNAYDSMTDTDLKRVILFDVATLEGWISRVGPLRINGEVIDGNTVTAFLTRSVSAVDRHNEVALSERKVVLKSLGVRLVVRTILQPWNWWKVSYYLRKQINNASVYWPNISNGWVPSNESLALIHWNLGGGKSSRFLNTSFNWRFYEYLPGKWNITGVLHIYHSGSYQEPLSQNYTGVLEVKLPEFMGGDKRSFDLNLKPGESWDTDFTLSYEGALPGISWFVPRGQKVDMGVWVSHFGETLVKKSDIGTVKDNTIKILKTFGFGLHQLTYEIQKDTKNPFLTLHKTIPKAALPSQYVEMFESSNTIVELHFNESVRVLDVFDALLQDVNWTTKQTSEAILNHAVLLEDQRTMVLGFTVTPLEINERFNLRLKGVQDLFGNEMKAFGNTIIIR